jgi:hypothetical protein
MGFRFRKSIKVAPGVRVNVGKRGASSVTIGPRGSSMSVGKRGTLVNAGIPGTGLSYRAKIGGNKTGGKEPRADQPSPAAQKASWVVLLVIIGGGLWMCSKHTPSKNEALDAAQATTLAQASPAMAWHAIGPYTVGMGIDEVKRRGVTKCTPKPKGQECAIPDGKAFGAPYSRGYITFSGMPLVASQIRVGVEASDMPTVVATLGAPSVRSGGSRKILYWSRGGDLVVSRTSETLTVESKPGLASQLIPRK